MDMLTACCALFFQKYKSEGHDTIILAGAEYGSGSSRDWAAKGPMLQVSDACSHLILYDFLLSTTDLFY